MTLRESFASLRADIKAEAAHPPPADALLNVHFRFIAASFLDVVLSHPYRVIALVVTVAVAGELLFGG